MELKKELEKLKEQLEKDAIKKKENSEIRDIYYYKNITFDNVKGHEHPLYLIEKEVDGKIKRELQIGNMVIADIGEDNTIKVRDEFSSMVKDTSILIALRDIAPISLSELEKQEEQEKEVKEENQTEKDRKEKKIEQTNQKQEQEGSNPYSIAEIDLNKKITETKSFADLVPEVKQKQIEKVKVRRIDMTRFEFYGIGKEGEYIPIESLKRVEGTNPTKEINEVNADGSKVEKNQVYSMFQIANGTNEQAGNEGFTVDLEEGTGIPKVAYYRRARGIDTSFEDASNYTSIPVNLKNTNQKRTEKEVREYGEKQRNPEIRDNIEKANDILEKEEETSLENIDDNPYNDKDMQENELIREAAKRCKVSEEAFIKEMESIKSKDDTLEEQIEKAEDSINEQVIGTRQR